MSYILKALRKSEAERAKGTVPKLTPHHEPVAPRQGSIWPWVAVAALVVNAVIGGAVLWRSEIMPWLQEAGYGPDKPFVAETMPTRPAAQPAPAGQATPAAAPETADSTPSPEPQTSAKSQPAPSTPQLPMQAPAETQGAEKPESAATPATAAAPQNAGTAAAKPPVAATESVELLETPAADSEVADAPDTAARIVGAVEKTPVLTATKARPTPAEAVPMAPAPPRKPPQIENLAAILAATGDQDDPLDDEVPWEDELKGADLALADDDPLPPEFASDQAADLYEGIPMLWQMPRSFRSRLPTLSISVHVYSPDEPGRFVIIDRKKYWEGDNLTEGVVLEAIVPDGVVMEYQGQQFRLSSR